jgi:hypothetical protein
MQEFKWETELNGSFFHTLQSYQRPCIYGWFRRHVCLYIGQSRRGILRVINHHHVIGIKDFIREIDQICLFYPEIRANDTLDFWEARLIKKFNPKLNIARPNETTTIKGVSKLPENIPAKERLAEILSSDLQDRILLANAQGRSDPFADFTPDELREFLRECKQITSLQKQICKDKK